MHLELKKYRLQLAHTFTISRESHDAQDSLIVCLSLDGKTGYGEATANPYYNITVESMMAEIKAVEDKIVRFIFSTPENFHQHISSLNLSQFAICALDLAANDLYGKLKNHPLYQLWGYNPNIYPITNYTIGIDTVEKMKEKILEKPWPIYKIKLGTEDDVAIIKELRSITEATFRVDANCAWSAKETIENAVALKELGVEFIEQPLKADNWSGMKQVYNKSVLPLIADESCIVESDVEKCAGHFHGVNIKLVKCGGLTPARRMIQKARDLNLKVMVGCMTESTVGISAIAQIAPALDYVDMDGAMLLKNDIATGIHILPDGQLQYPNLPGSGVTLLS
jgi:L-alanine-DL-glutamate epimerase-like enolase superfamily enzyme